MSTMSLKAFVEPRAAAAACLLGALLFRTAAASPLTSEAMTLENGLRVFLLENRRLPLIHVVVGVKAGSRCETPRTNGLTHLLEHLILFRGTRTRTAEEVNSDLRRNGAYFNAHTGQDLSLFELTLPAGREEFALRNQREIIFAPAFDREGDEDEKTVILEEMSREEDDPNRAALALLYRNLFPGHPYSLPLAGTRETLSSVAVEDLAAFHGTHFLPSNAALAAVGDFRLEDMKKKVLDIFGSLPKTEPPPPPPPLPPPRLSQDLELTLEMDIPQAYCLLGFQGPDYNHPDQFAVDLLTEILGRGVNPMLGSALRSRRKLAESAAVSFHAHEWGGAIVVTLSSEPKNVKAAGREALSFLRTAGRLNFSPDDVFGPEKEAVFDFLGSAKNQIRFLAEKSGESGLNLAVGLVRHMLLASGEGRGGYLENIERLTTSDLRKAAAKYFGSAKAVVVRVVPFGAEKRR